MRILRTLFIFALLTDFIVAQTCPSSGITSCTPNLGLFLPPPSYQNWNTPTNANWSLIDTAWATTPKSIINPVSKGLVCDGTTVNSTATMAALNAAAVSGTVFSFPPSAQPCILPSALVPQANNVAYWAEPNTVTLKMAGGDVANVGLFSTGSSNIYVYGLTFDGNLSGVPGAENVIQVYGGSSPVNNTVFDTITVQNTRGIGVVFSANITNSGVRNSVFNNVGNYWQTSGSNGDQRQGVAFTETTAANSYGNFVTHSTFTSTGLDAVSATTQTNFDASGNIFKSVGGRYTNGGAAVYGAGNSSMTVTGNVVSGTFGNGIDIASSSLATVVGNTVQFAGQGGIIFGGVTGGTISGNVSCNNNQSGGASSLQGGIAFNAPDADITVSGNTACDNQGSPTQTYGIQEIAGSYSGMWIDSSNVIYGNVTSSFGGALTGPSIQGTAGTYPIFSSTTGLGNGTISTSGGIDTDTNQFNDATIISAPTFYAYYSAGEANMYVDAPGSASAAIYFNTNLVKTFALYRFTDGGLDLYDYAANTTPLSFGGGLGTGNASFGAGGHAVSGLGTWTFTNPVTFTRASNAVTSATGGSGTGTVTCATAACTNTRGSYTVAGGTFATGTLLTLVWPATTTAYVCNGTVINNATGASIGYHGVATTTGMTFSSLTAATGLTVDIDYSCQP